ncbi:MAG: bifunctional adenosylcobinamide kinase/adenosylcobinamide-phosphate guanylyltransferase [Crinalium sp.]
MVKDSPTSTKSLILITGPSRSGKSEWAETLAMRSGKPVFYLATAQVDLNDTEWQARIEQHQLRRPANWQTLCEPVNLSATIAAYSANHCLLVDSLGTWVANLLEEDNETWDQTSQELITSLQQATGDLILVAEETGWGIVPAYKSGRVFRDRLGMLVRRIGAIANPVYLVTGGYVLNLCELGSPLPQQTN